MSDVTGTPGSRTRYTSKITLSARESEAVWRFLRRRTVAGDVTLVDRVIYRIVENSNRVKPCKSGKEG
jgi:hypothetical protein